MQSYGGGPSTNRCPRYTDGLVETAAPRYKSLNKSHAAMPTEDGPSITVQRGLRPQPNRADIRHDTERS